MIAIIGGTTYSIKTNTFQSEDTIEMRATCSFSIVDKQNEYSFHKGQPVRIEDDKNNNELVFAGYLETSDKYPLASKQANVYMHDIVCIDMHYLTDKRRISYAARNKLAGDIIKDIVDQKLVEEGVYYSKDLNFVETTTDDFSTGELSNVIAENDSLRLDKVGSDVTDIDNDNASFSEGTLTDVVAVNDGLELEKNSSKNLHTESMGTTPASFVNTTETYWSKKIVHNGDESGNSYNIPTISCKPNTTYTFSIYVKLASGSLSTDTVQIYLRDNDGANNSGTYFIDGEITSEYKRFEISLTTNSNATELTRASIWLANTVDNAELHIKNWQLEEGNSATPFVLPERNIGISNQGGYHTNSGYLEFDVYKKMRLESAIIDADFTGDVVFELQTRDGTKTLKSKTFTISSTGEQRIYFNWEIDKGSYNIGRYDNANNTPLKRLPDTATFPYDDEYGVMSITGSSATGFYYYLFDWNIFCGNEPIGTRQSPQLDLSAVNDVASSSISWQETLNSQTITIETSVDGGSTWQTATNGGAIPNLPANPTTLDVRQTLSTTDTTVTPVLNSIEVEVVSAYETTGYRISEPFDLSPAAEDGGSTISWQETTPANTSITVETSLDDGVTWDTATNGQPIPNLPTDLTDVQLKYKSTLNTTDGSVTPTFDEADISVLAGNPSIEDGVEILETRANFVPTEQLISSVADKMNYWWKIDSNKMIHFKSRDSEPADWELEPQYIRGLPTTKTGNPLYRNQQLVKGPVGITEEQTDIERGDGEKKAFPVSFPIAEEPTIEISINGGAWQTQTVGRKGVDDGFQWYWEKESDIITHDNSETRLTSNDRVRCTFIGQFKIVAQTYDPNLIAQQADIDGTSGIVEDAITVGNVEGREAAIEIGNSKIEKYGVDSKRLNFQTRRNGLKAGQLITVRNLDAMDIADGEKLLITKTSTFDENGQIFYDISAVKGPKHRTWEEFFMELTKRAELVISEGIGESEILIIPIDFSKTWTEAENPNIFRKLKADGTWLADGTYTPNFEDADRVTHIAWFNGTTELGRQERTQQDVNTADRVNTLTYLGPNSANEDITHFGWIGGFRATEEVGTGVLIDKIAYDLIKEETEALQITRDDYSWNY